MVIGGRWIGSRSIGDTAAAGAVSTSVINGRAKVWNGTTWVKGRPKVYNGASWSSGSWKTWNGTTWVYMVEL